MNLLFPLVLDDWSKYGRKNFYEKKNHPHHLPLATKIVTKTATIIAMIKMTDTIVHPIMIRLEIQERFFLNQSKHSTSVH